VTRKIGIYNLWINGGGGGEKKTCALAEHFSRSDDVWLITGEEPSKAALESYFGVDLGRVRVFVPPRPVVTGIRRLAQSIPSSFRGPLQTEMLLKTIDRMAEPASYSSIKALGLDVCVNCQWASLLPCPAPEGFYMCMFPHALKGSDNPERAASFGQRARFRTSNRLLGMSRQVIDSYTAVTANSAFTSEWIQKMWDVTAPVVYSTGERMGPALPKEKMILNVGRFVGVGRADDKHQATMLKTFRKLEDLHNDGWQLHFAGTILPGEDARRQASELASAARGLPVVFHFDAGFLKLRELYRRAAIYWHATGFGSSPTDRPEKQEHFGVTTVEAMSAGAVPVVINSGGQREIVTHELDGFLWDDLDGLVAHTRRLAGDAELSRRLSLQALLSSARFSTGAFLSRIEQLIETSNCPDRHTRAPHVP